MSRRAARADRAVWRAYLGLLLVAWTVLSLGAAAVVIRARHDAVESQERAFSLRTSLAAESAGNLVQSLERELSGWGGAQLSGRTVRPEQLRAACATTGFSQCGLFDDSGRVITNAPYMPQYVGRDFSDLEQVSGALADGRPVASPVIISPVLHAPVVAVGVPFATPYGRRVVTGVFSVQDSALAARLATTVDLPGNDLFVVDAKGVVAASPRRRLLGTRAPLSTYAPRLGQALGRTRSGDIGDRYYTSAPIVGTSWRLVATVDRARLEAAAGSLATVSLWVVVVGSLVGLAAVLALTRSLYVGATAAAERAALVADAAQRQRYAQEVNDEIVQGLVGAELAYDLGQPDRSRELLRSTSSQARAWISAQRTAGGPYEAGSLRRTRPGGADREREDA